MYYSYLPEPLCEYIKHEGGSFCVSIRCSCREAPQAKKDQFLTRTILLDIDVFVHVC